MRRKLNQRFGWGILLGLVALLVCPLLWHHNTPPAHKPIGSSYSRTQFFNRLAPSAKTLSTYYGVRTSVLLAQAALDSNYGSYLVAERYHNLYSLKATATDTSVPLRLKTYQDGRWDWAVVSFVVYPSFEASMEAYIENIRTQTYGEKGFYQELVLAPSYQSAAQVIQDKLYPRQIHYADRLIAIIERYHLEEYDKK